jgi:K+-sensing histidine kinase KdpD
VVRFIRSYCVGIAAACVALIVTSVVSPMIEPVRSPLLLAAVVFSAWYGGLGAGLLTSAIAVFTKMYFILPPRGFRVGDAGDVLYLLVLVAIFISALTGALQRAEGVNRTLAVKERTARAEAEAPNRAKDVFLAKNSHELRTPLQAASTWAHALPSARGDK